MNESHQEPTMIILEDERPLSAAIQKKLRMNSIEAVTSRSVEQAMGYLKDLERVDAIWVDHYLLGKETGLDFVAKLKADGSPWKQIPVIVVSNTGSPDKVQSYLALGVSKYYTKAEHRLDEIILALKELLTSGA